MHTDLERTGITEDIVGLIPALRGYAWVLTRRKQEVDDLVQDTLLKAIAHVERFESGTNLRAWLMTIMRNTFLNGIQRRAREMPGRSDCVSVLPETPATQEWSLKRRELSAAIDDLAPHYREALILVVVLGESYDTTARICGIEIGTVKSRVARARHLVTRRLEEPGRGHDGSMPQPGPIPRVPARPAAAGTKGATAPGLWHRGS